MKGAVAIDANLLLLLIVGLAERRYIGQHKRLRDVYTAEDFDLLIMIVEQFSSIVLLPNTLTEVSNLVRHIANPARTHVALTMRTLIDGTDEQFIQSRRAAVRSEFSNLGLTDAALLEFSSMEFNGSAPTLLTVDLDLALAAEMSGYFVENFNHYRDTE